MRSKTGTVRECLYFKACGKREVHDGIVWRNRWSRFNDNWLCHPHYMSVVANPKQTSESIKNHNLRKTSEQKKKRRARRFNFLGKEVYLDHVARIGQCSVCDKKVGDEFIGFRGKLRKLNKTHIHHWFYLPIMIWACTIELCSSCHGIEGWNLEQMRFRRRNGGWSSVQYQMQSQQQQQESGVIIKK